ncbi:MAG: LexA family transcriptional regulator [Phycisphaeraceae bacterium]|nr:LexA family transcriptional regulator [Phycisphaeraceae bacterium]
MNPMGEAIKRLREERGWTQSQLGEKVGLDHTNIARRESGKTRVKANERFQFAQAFGMSVIEFDECWRQFAIRPERKVQGIPIINRAPAGEAIEYDEYGVDSQDGMAYVDRGDIQDERAFGVIVTGDSMQPRLGDGDYLILSPVDPYRGDGKLADGKIVFVRFTQESGGGCAIARFFAEDNGMIRLQKDNPAYKAIVCHRETIQLVAVAIERREKL